MPISLARSCEDCLCAPLKETCLFGPDSLGNFATSEVDLEFAETCPRETCTCTSHENYTEVAQERLALAARVYAIEIGAEFSHGIDPSLIIDADAIAAEQKAAKEAAEQAAAAEQEAAAKVAA